MQSARMDALRTLQSVPRSPRPPSRRRTRIRVVASVSHVDRSTLALDDDQERRGDSCISAKEKPWRTASRAKLAAELDDDQQSRRRGGRDRDARLR
jgi:hypothetical protein